MTVQELMDTLRDMDPDADVLIMVQPSWPFEHTLRAAQQRSDFESDEDCDRNLNDVVLTVGSSLRYGNPDAWS